MNQRLLFAHVSWMPEYLGKPDEPMFSTHGYVIENKIGHERWNFKPEAGRLLGYVPIRSKSNEDAPGEIAIEKLGADRTDPTIAGVSVVWFANNPADRKQAYIAGWYRNATVYRAAQFRRHREFRMSCALDDATLLAEAARKFPIPHVRSVRGQKLGYGYGQSSVWYAENAPNEFHESVRDYMEAVEKLSAHDGNRQAVFVADAIDDLDDTNLGNQSPDRRKTQSTFIVRDPQVRRRVISRADGRCEYCGALGFERDDGSNFVEAHHIIHLSKQGPDTLENVIGLCPNHHREAHFGKHRSLFESELITKLLHLRVKK